MHITLVILGILSLILSGFMLIYYGYLFRKTDHDVSFFISAAIILIVMNLFTNMASTTIEITPEGTITSYGAKVLTFLYLILAVLGLGAGFLIDKDASVDFYTSIGTWCVSTFTDTALVGWKLLSFIIAPAGIVLYFVFYKSNHELSLVCGKAGIWGLLLWVVLIWMIFGTLSGSKEITTAAVTLTQIL